MRTISSEATIERYVSKFNMTSFLNDDLLRHLQLFHFPAYSNIYIEQDEQHFLYFLVEGQVQCSHYHLNGKLAVIAISKPFAAIGDLEILNEERVHSNVIAIHDTTMLGIARPVVHRYGVDDACFLRFLIEQLRGKLYETNSLQVNQILPVINQLSAYILAHLSNHDTSQATLPSKKDLASLLGTTTRHLNRVLKQLTKSGYIHVDYPTIIILDRDALQDFNG